MNCRQCGEPLVRPERSHAESDNTGVRLDKSLWLTHLEDDPFCGAACARAFYAKQKVSA